MLDQLISDSNFRIPKESAHHAVHICSRNNCIGYALRWAKQVWNWRLEEVMVMLTCLSKLQSFYFCIKTRILSLSQAYLHWETPPCRPANAQGDTKCRDIIVVFQKTVTNLVEKNMCLDQINGNVRSLVTSKVFHFIKHWKTLVWKDIKKRFP